MWPGCPVDCVVSERVGRKKRALKIRAVCPQCSVDAPLLDNQCQQCRTSFMVRCRRCGGVAHLAEPRCEFCGIDHPALGNPASRDLDGPPPPADAMPAPAPVGPGGQPVPPPPAFGPDGQPLAPVGVPFAQLPGSGAGAPMPAYVPGVTTGPPPAGPSGARSVRRRRSTAGASLLIALGVLARFGGWYLIDELEHRDSSSNQASAAPAITPRTAPVPTEWDTRIQPLAEFVEQQHGGKFDHPVDVEFLDEDAFVAEITGSDGPRAQGFHAEAGGTSSATDPTLALYRALGLVNGQLDVEGQQADLDAVSIVGLYSPSTKRLMVRGTHMTVSVEVTVVHELTHAWQDQHYDLTGHEQDAPDQRAAWLGLVEGDASRVQQEYFRQLAPQDKQQYSLESAAFVGQHQGEQTRAEQIDATPDVLRGNAEFPYLWGEGFAESLVRHHDDATIDNSLVDAAFANPPASTQQVLFPASYLAHPAAATVGDPALPAGATEVGRGTVGAFDLLLTLGERLGHDRGMNAVRGWGADRYLLSEEGGHVCVHLAVAGLTPADTATLGTALTDWAATVPGATGTAAADAARLDVCDTGGQWPTETGDPYPTLATAEIRAQLVGTMQGWLGRPEAECAVDGLRSILGDEALAQSFATDDADVFNPAAEQALRACEAFFPDLARNHMEVGPDGLDMWFDIDNTI